MTQTAPSSHGRPLSQFAFTWPSGEHQYIAIVPCYLIALRRFAGICLLFCVVSQWMLGQTPEPAATIFKQREPYEGQPATERTEARVLYTRNEVYFGVACHDSVATGPVATQLRRDVTQELDDYFEVVIDSRFDRRNAYVFQVNPLGTQRDALITDEQVQETQDGDPGWDGVWTSEARRTQEG